MSEDLNQHYVVLAEIGRGRFGTIFRCASVDSGGAYAVKSIDKRVISAGDSLDAQCLLTESEILHLLSPHPHILNVHNVYDDDTHLHLVLDLCHSDLHQRIVALGSIPEPDAAVTMTQLMRAVAHCHRFSVAHRDIKPENILFDEQNRLKLADFGSAEIFKDGQPMRGVVGTPYYVAPEVLVGGEYNEKVDVWSAGVVLYVMLAAFPPFNGDSTVEIFDAVIRANLRFPSQVFHSVSPAAKDLLRRMLCRDASRRLTAEQVLRHPWFNVAGETLAIG